MSEIFYLLAGMNLLLHSVVMAAVVYRGIGVHWAHKGDDEPDEGEKAWNDGFLSLLAYDIEKAKGSVRDDGRTR